MNTTKFQPAQPSLERLALSNKPRVIVTQKLKNQIDWLHEKCGATEWSGELITSEINTINDLDNWTIKCEDIFLVDIGSSAYTSYEVDKGGFKSADIIDLYDSYPGLLDGTQKAQHIHTHHSMQSFFSGTDWSQLEDRGILSNYFLMLIVNFKGEYVAKVAFKAEKSGKDAVELNFANNLDGRAPLTLSGQTAKEVLVVMDCIIEFEKPEQSVEESFSTRYDVVKTALAEEAAKRVYTPAYGGFGTPKRAWKQTEFTAWDDEIDDLTVGKFSPKKKGIMDLTEKEWNEENIPKSKITEKDAYFALSSYLSGTYDKSNYEPPLDLIIDLNKQLKKKAELEEYLMEFGHGGFKAHIEGIHLDCGPEDHIALLEHLIKYLEESKYNRLSAEMLEEVKDMMEDAVNDLLDNHTSFGSQYEPGGWIN